jgi:hypothetical protein
MYSIMVYDELSGQFVVTGPPHQDYLEAVKEVERLTASTAGKSPNQYRIVYSSPRRQRRRRA